MNFSFNRNLLANLIGRSWTPILSIFFLPITVRLMGIEAYGLVGFYVTLINIINVLEMGLGPTLNRELASISSTQHSTENQRNLTRSFELIIVSIALAVGLILFLASPYISGHWIKEQELSHETVLTCVQLMVFAIVFQFPQSFYNSGLMALHKQINANIFLVLYGSFRVLGSVGVLYFLSSEPQFFFLWHLIISLLGFVVLHLLFWHFLPQSEKKPTFKFMYIENNWRYSIVIFGNAIVGIFLTQLDRVLLSKTLTLKMFSYYAIATTLASGLGMIVAPFSSLVFSQYVRLKETNALKELTELFHKTSQNMAVLMFPLCSVLIFYSKPLIIFWMKDPVIAEQSYLIANLFIIGGIINAIATLPINCALAFGWPKLIFWSNLLQMVLMVPVIYFLVRWYQGIGAGISWIILNSLYLIFTVPLFFKKYFSSEVKTWYIKDIGIPLFSCFTTAGLTWLISPILTNQLHVLLWIGGSWLITFIVSIFFLPYVKGEITQRIFTMGNVKSQTRV
jgi:O-antigen/teichoic acid export membrane protein